MSEKTVLLIKNDIGANSNKYYSLKLEGQQVTAVYGRVGDEGQKKIYSGGQYTFDKKYREKLAKGYVETRTVDNNSIISVPKQSLLNIAKEQIKISGGTIVEKLIERLVAENIHNICSSTAISYNKDSNTFSTPLGILTKDAILEARNILEKISKHVKEKDWNSPDLTRFSQNYLTLVPTNFGRKKFNPQLFFDGDGLKKQLDILDSLDASLIAPKQTSSKINEVVFDLSLSLVEGFEFDRLNKLFLSTKNTKHVSSNYKLKSVYKISCPFSTERFNPKNLDNIRELWHGTKSNGALSILKSGLKINPPSTASIQGKAYGNGIYFSDQSTKSLNYTTSFWGGKTGNIIIMFLADVAMGKVYIPQCKNWGYVGKLPKEGFDSTFAKAGESGVINNEMIVYNENQVNLKYLLEFTI